MALWVTPLLCQHEALSSDPQSPGKKPGVVRDVCNPSAGGQRPASDSCGLHSASLAEMVHSDLLRPCLKIKVDNERGRHLGPASDPHMPKHRQAHAHTSRVWRPRLNGKGTDSIKVLTNAKSR